MNLLSIYLWLYAGLLRLYPGAFRAEFSAEMRDAFTSLLHEELEHGGPGLLLAFLRELRDVPIAALRLRLSGERHRESAISDVPQPSGHNPTGTFSAAGYAGAFGLAGLAPALVQQWLHLVKADAARCVRLPDLPGRQAWDCHALPFLLAPGPLLYYAVCGCCGAAVGVLLGRLFKERRAQVGLALAGFVSFSLGAVAAELWLPPIFRTESLAAIGSLTIAVTFMGLLMSLFLCVASRDWPLFFRLSARGPAALASGSVLGFLIAMLLWALAQAWASNQATAVYMWVIKNGPAALPGVLTAVACVTWGIAIAEILARRRGLSSGTAC